MITKLEKAKQVRDAKEMKEKNFPPSYLSKTKNKTRKEMLRLVLSFFIVFFLPIAVTSCANDAAPSIGEIKAYPSPFAPGDVLKVSLTSGAFPTDSRVTLKVLDYNFTKIFEREFSPATAGTPPKVEWSGYISGKRLAPGMYTIRLDITLSDHSARSGETRLVVE